ncbi:protein ENDOSPERM DEFECTIVE 1-like [Musa acuminata AAA Group]|uniref:protein ENDOSPERM DEFECTIVE 1-like n=1 Tax=Musa acuminata AAA Group TaxID=214697 RepID=UPI0031E1ACBB
MIAESDLHFSDIPLPPPSGSDAEGKHRSLPPPTPVPSATQPPVPTPLATDRKSRRPRARQISSRYLSPSSSPYPSSSSSVYSSETLRFAASPRNGFAAPSSVAILSKKHQQQKPHRSHPSSPGPELEEADENQPLASVRRSSETPLPFSAHGKPIGTIKKRAVVRLFTDNHSDAAEQPPRLDDPGRRPRPGTPVAHHRVLDSTTVLRTNTRPPTPSRVSLFPSDGYRWAHGSGDCGLDETTSENSFSDTETCSVSSQGGLCDSPPLLPPASCRSRLATDVRSSMPEADLLPTMSARRQDGAEVSSCRSSTSSLFLRSLSSAFSGRQQQHPFNLSKSVNRPLFSSKPPQPPSYKPAAEVKKVNKALGRQEDAHVLRLLDNCYVQWRFLNAKARGTVEARGVAAQKSLCGLSGRIAELQSSVMEKRIQLEQLKRRERLLFIIHHQMSHLDEWTVLEDDYSSTLLGATKALQDASLRLPIAGNVRVDTRELREVMDSALLMLELLSPCVARFLSKAEDVDHVASGLASVISTQRVLVDECGNLLSEAHVLQVKECSLRTQLIQVKHRRTQ